MKTTHVMTIASWYEFREREFGAKNGLGRLFLLLCSRHDDQKQRRRPQNTHHLDSTDDDDFDESVQPGCSSYFCVLLLRPRGHMYVSGAGFLSLSSRRR
jgi:hypothetical protein